MIKNAQLNGTGQAVSKKIVSPEMVSEYASKYIQQALGALFQPQKPKFQYGRWTVGLLYNGGNGQEPLYAGFLRTDEETGKVCKLSDDKIWDFKERTKYLVARQRGEVGRTDEGYILPYRARISVNSYMGNTITMFAGSAGIPQLIPGDPTLWRVKATFSMPKSAQKITLGTVDVDALTGEVIPLTNTQIDSMTRLAQDAAERSSLSVAATD